MRALILYTFSMRACLVLALVFVTAATFSATRLAAAEVPAELLARIEAIRQAGKQHGAELWPGWDPTATPIAIHRARDLGVLVGHPHPPASFRAYPTTLVSAPVFVADTMTGMILANSAQLFGGTLTSFIGYRDIMEKQDVAEAVALGIHELFHAHEQKIAPNKFGNILTVLWGEYPEFSARNRVLLQLEAEALRNALRAPSAEEQRRHAADFLGLRAERRKEMSADVARYESGEEAVEGLARYIEYRLLEVAYSAKTNLRENRIEELTKIGSLTRDRERFYVLGMAEGLLLDRLRPGWKKEYETSDAMLDGLLARAVPAAIFQRDLKALMNEQEKELAQREGEGSRRLGTIMAKGRRVVIEVAGVKDNVQLRGINPNGAVQLTPKHIAHTFLILDLKGGAGPETFTWRLEFTTVPVIYDKLQDAFWCMLPDDIVKEALERLAEKPERLFLKGPGFLLDLENALVSQRGQEVRVVPNVQLKRKPLNKPEIFKPPL